ncbi:Hypothetical protein A7982_07121 [Minicystis rosea]|nr:Hypothetical protein A7982_07121 [Minicystis rosea]
MNGIRVAHGPRMRTTRLLSSPLHFPLAILLSMITGLAACGGNNEATGGGGAAPTTGSGGSGGGPPSCPEGSHTGASGACEATLSGWSDGPKLNDARDHHASLVLTDPDGKTPFLYVLGGVQDDATILRSIERAAINPDGTLGTFEKQTDLPEGMAGLAVAVIGSTVIISGGLRPAGSGVTLSAKSHVATMGKDGILSAWAAGPTMGKGRFHHSMIGYKGFVYAVGGLTGNAKDNTPSIERATLNADGTLSPWTEVSALPAKRSHHGLAIHDGALFVTGGLSGDPAANPMTYDDVLRAPLNDDGSLGAWTTAGTLAITVATHSSFAHVGQLYVAGGVEGNATNTKHVKRATIAADGTLGAWEALPDLPKARAHVHQTPLYKGFIYSAGGALNHASMDDVVVGKLE